MHFGLIVLLCFHFTSTMSSEEDDFSLSGLTQQDPEYQELPAESSDEDGIDNLQLLFESARKLVGGEVQDFEEAVFDIGMSSSEATQSSQITLSVISVGTENPQRPSKRLRYSEMDPDSDLDVSFICLFTI